MNWFSLEVNLVFVFIGYGIFFWWGYGKGRNENTGYLERERSIRGLRSALLDAADVMQDLLKGEEIAKEIAPDCQKMMVDELARTAYWDR